MSSLILNFDWDSTPKDSTTQHTRPTAGTWTQKLRQKKLAKHHQKLRNKEKPQTTPEQPQTTEKHPQKNIQPPSDTGPRKKPKLDPKTTPHKFQIISSLFSSTIIPTIKPNPNHEQSSMVVYAPSNASLSEIRITSPSLNLHPQISQHLHSSTKLGPIHSPTSIQSIAWPLLSAQSNHSTRDVIIQSETGSGKTLAYLVPIIQDLLTLPLNSPQINWNREIGTLAIILVPTRELAEQVYHVAINLLSFTQKNRPDDSGNLDHAEGDQEEHEEDPVEAKVPLDHRLNPRWLVPGTLHGGTNRTHEKARLRKGLPLLACTPGRLLDHLEKTVSLRMAGETKKVSTNERNPNKIKIEPKSVDSNLNLRWLVVDEADRLMDMGFEEQMSGILKHLKQRETKPDVISENHSTTRRTILCSATMPDGVKKLVGMSLNDPILLKASGLPSSDQEQTELNNNSTTTQDQDQSENDHKFSAPSQLSQYYVVTPPKLRLVSLIALLRQITNPNQRKPAEKILVFMSCTASVDFHFEALGNLISSDDDHNEKENDEDGENKKNEYNRSTIMRKSKLIPGVKIFRLHGSLDLQTRLKSLNKFSEKNEAMKSNSSSSNSSILFCTSLAGRGLDVPFVSHVIQYDLPTEGGVTEYLHRIGRTARAGQTGQAWSFLLPSESGWIDWCEQSQNRHLDADQRPSTPKLNQIDVQKLLADGFLAKSQNEWESLATDTQMNIEKWVLQNPKNRDLATIGFTSHIRAYTTHPTKEKIYFNLKNIHLGHLAKSFGLRDPPKNLTSTSFKSESSSKKQQQTKRNNNKMMILDEEDDDSDLDDFKTLANGKGNGKGSFLPLSQAIPLHHKLSLKGPLGNSIDEFNLG